MKFHAHKSSDALHIGQASRAFSLCSELLSNSRMKTAEENRQENLILIAKELGSMAEVSRKTGIAESQLGQWAKAHKDSKTGKPRKMTSESARAIEQALGKERAWMDQDHSQALDNNLSEDVRPPGKVPLISWVQAGDYKAVIDNLSPGDAEEWIGTEAPVRKHTYALRVVGDSMEPEFPEGSIIIVEPTLLADPGNYVIVRNGEHEATFKQLIRDGADWLLKPVNPRYPIKPMPRDAQVVGVVRERQSVKKYR